MIKLILLFMIIGIKILLTKGLVVIFILLSVFIKGKSSHFDEKQWDVYFKGIKEKIVLNYTKIIYLSASLFASFIAYLLFRFAEFQYPLSLTILLYILTSFYSWMKYRKEGKQKIIDACDKLHKDPEHSLN